MFFFQILVVLIWTQEIFFECCQMFKWPLKVPTSMFYDYCPNIQPTPWKEYQTTQKSVQNFKPNLHSLHELVIVRFLKLDNTDVLRRIIVCCVSCALWSVVPSVLYQMDYLQNLLTMFLFRGYKQKCLQALQMNGRWGALHRPILALSRWYNSRPSIGLSQGHQDSHLIGLIFTTYKWYSSS